MMNVDTNVYQQVSKYISKKMQGKNSEPLKNILVHYYPQDLLVSQLSNASIPASFVKDGTLSGARDIVKEVKQAGDEMNKIPKLQLSLDYDDIDGESDEVLYAADRLLGEQADKLGLLEIRLPAAVKVVRNKEGETFYHYKWTNEEQLVGQQYKQYNGAYFDVDGSLILGFDEERNLMHVEKNPITQERVDDVKAHIKYLINEGLVKYFKPFQTVSTHDLFKSDGHPYAAYTTYSNNGEKMKLVPVTILT